MTEAKPKADNLSYNSAIGRTESRSGLISEKRAMALAATLDQEHIPADSEPLQPGWHWLYFNPFVKRSDIGTDGHPKRGGFLPDVKLPRRMWAGGRINYHSPLPIGSFATKKSEIKDVVSKSGRAGELVFVTVKHEISVEGTLCIEEEQDIVYREAPAKGAPKAIGPLAPETATHSEVISPDPVLLFRYSALTSNGHRIHYDRNYAQNEEDYHDLVVHGPLTATLLQGLAKRVNPNKTLISFEFRGMAPLFADRAFHIEAEETDKSLSLWARGPNNELAMKAKAEFV